MLILRTFFTRINPNFSITLTIPIPIIIPTIALPLPITFLNFSITLTSFLVFFFLFFLLRWVVVLVLEMIKCLPQFLIEDVLKANSSSEEAAGHQSKHTFLLFLFNFLIIIWAEKLKSRHMMGVIFNFSFPSRVNFRITSLIFLCLKFLESFVEIILLDKAKHRKMM